VIDLVLNSHANFDQVVTPDDLIAALELPTRQGGGVL
jgi:hypothetical protein